MMEVRPSSVTRHKKWFIGGGLVTLCGLGVLIFALVVRFYLYEQTANDMYRMRYLPVENNAENCGSQSFGDATCAGTRLEAMQMSSADKTAMCMSDSPHPSKVFTKESKWCPAGSEGCDKAKACKPGVKYAYTMYTILNPLEVINGLTPEIQELDPLYVSKITEKKVDSSRIRSHGVLAVSESSRYELQDERAAGQKQILDTVITVPNMGMFSVYNLGYIEASGDCPLCTRPFQVDNLFFFMAGLKTMAKYQDKVTKVIGESSMQRSAFGYNDALLKRFMRDNFRSASHVRRASYMMTQLDFFNGFFERYKELGYYPQGKLMLTFQMTSESDKRLESPFARNIAAQPTLALGLSVKTGVPFSYYEFEKDCLHHSDPVSGICDLRVICPDSAKVTNLLDEADFDDCTRPSLSVSLVDELFDHLIDPYGDAARGTMSEDDKKASDDQIKKTAMRFLASCQFTATGSIVQDDQCTGIAYVITKLGRWGFSNKENDKLKPTLEALGWDDTDFNLEYVGPRVAPYFYRATVGSVLNYSDRSDPAKYKPIIEPNSNEDISLKLFKDENFIADDQFFTKSTDMQVSDVHGHKGLNYIVAAKGKKKMCFSSKACMEQKKFHDSLSDDCDDSVSVASLIPSSTSQATCDATSVEGYEGTVLPGEIMGHPTKGTKDFSSAGSTARLFVPDFWMHADVKLNTPKADWKGLKVNVWNLDNVVLKDENCDKFQSDHLSAGLDCSSPQGTAFVGFGKSPRPHELAIPSYASLPHFSVDKRSDTGINGLTGTRVGSSGLASVASSGAPPVYDPRTKILVHPSATSVADAAKAAASASTGGNSFAASTGMQKQYSTEMWTEPHTGIVVYGRQRLQVNTRMSSDLSTLLGLSNNAVSSGSSVSGSGSAGSTSSALKSVVPGANYNVHPTFAALSEETQQAVAGFPMRSISFSGKPIDTMMPTLYVSKYDQANEYQRGMLADMQNKINQLDKLFLILVIIGPIVLVAGLLLTYMSCVMRSKDRQRMIAQICADSKAQDKSPGSCAGAAPQTDVSVDGISTQGTNPGTVTYSRHVTPMQDI